MAKELRSGIPDDAGVREGGNEACRRRMCMLRDLFATGVLDMEAFGQDPQKRRAFRHMTKPGLYDDVENIMETLKNEKWGILAKDGLVLRVLGQGAFGYEHLGYEGNGAVGSATDEKNRIARFIVDKLLVEQDVLYLSTGTTVFHVALELLKFPVKKAMTVLSHNLAVVDLFRHQGRWFPLPGNRRPIDLVILGGKADFGAGDIEPDEEDVSQLERWKCTKAIMSATAINPLTGEVFSYRLPKLKRTVLRNARVSTLIIPVTHDKVSAHTGGQKIPLPGEGMRKIIVTTGLPDDDRRALEGHGFDVPRV